MLSLEGLVVESKALSVALVSVVVTTASMAWPPTVMTLLKRTTLPLLVPVPMMLRTFVPSKFSVPLLAL